MLGQCVQRLLVEGMAGIEEYLADKNPIKRGALGGYLAAKPGEKCVEGFDGDDGRHRFTGLQPAFELARERVKFTITGQDAKRALAWEARAHAGDEFVGVWREGDAGGVGQVQFPGDVGAGGGEDFADDFVPFVVGQGEGVGGGLGVGVYGDVGP